MTKLALVGYGRMGKLLDKFAVNYDCEVVATIDPDLGSFLFSSDLSDVDVCLDFSLPDCVFDNIRFYTENKFNCVIGTTGWFDRYKEVAKLVEDSGIGMVYADNFSLGMNLFYKLIDYAGKLMDKVKEYDAFGLEMHHRFKADSPSGTARTISDLMLKNLSGKSSAQFDRLNRPIRPEEFHFASIRGGNIPGIHRICFDSDADTIELSHSARNRNGFAVGALLAAKMIKEKSGMFSFQDIFEQLFG